MNKQFLTFAAVVAGATPVVSNAAVQFNEQANTYTVKAGDSLFKIAKHIKRTRHSDRSINDTMLALYHANPQAFAGSIDVLKSNAVLTLPNFAGVVLSGTTKRHNASPNNGTSGGAPTALLQENTRLKASLRQKNRLIAVLDTKLDQSREALVKQAEPLAVTAPRQVVAAPADPKLVGFLASNTTWFIAANALLLLLVFWLVYRLWRQHNALQTVGVRKRRSKREAVGKRLLRQTTSGYYEMLSFARPAISYFGMDLRAGYDAMFQVSHADTVSAFRKPPMPVMPSAHQRARKKELVAKRKAPDRRRWLRSWERWQTNDNMVPA